MMGGVAVGLNGGPAPGPKHRADPPRPPTALTGPHPGPEPPGAPAPPAAGADGPAHAAAGAADQTRIFGGVVRRGSPTSRCRAPAGTAADEGRGVEFSYW